MIKQYLICLACVFYMVFAFLDTSTTINQNAGANKEMKVLIQFARGMFFKFEKMIKCLCLIHKLDTVSIKNFSQIMVVNFMNKETIIENPKNISPHIVLLGAGASRAAFPEGEANGKKLPLMSDFTEILDLSEFLHKNKIEKYDNFEEIYSKISDKIGNDSLVNELNEKIYKYFSDMKLTKTVTHYDRLLLSLRKKDVIFSFNWDPLLFDSYSRNCKVAPLPNIFFLHGNVRIGSCVNDDSSGEKNTLCPKCRNKFTDMPLLYPIGQKNYFNGNRYIASAWKEAEYYLANAFTITIFGYGAPIYDTEAKRILEKAWFNRSKRDLEHIEVIDTEKSDVLSQRWNKFIPTNHLLPCSSLEESRLWRWPRRSCESLFYPMSRGIPCEDFPLPETDNLDELHQYIKKISKYE